MIITFSNHKKENLGVWWKFDEYYAFVVEAQLIKNLFQLEITIERNVEVGRKTVLFFFFFLIW